MKVIKRIICLCLCGLMLLTQIKPVYALNPSTENLDFHVFLSQYLDDNYLLDKLDQPMAHQFMYESMQDEFGEESFLLGLTNIANDWKYPITGKVDMYEQVLLEMLVNHVNSDVFNERVKEDKIKIENEIFDFLKNSFDFKNLADDHTELNSILKKMDFKSWKDISKVPDEIFNKSIMELIDHNKIPISKSYKLNVTYNYIDFFSKTITYMSVCNQLDGITEVLEEMIRYSKDKDLKTAINKILNKLDSVSSIDLWDSIDANAIDFTMDSIETFIKDMVLTCFGIIGLSIETSSFISNIVFKTDVVAESYALLKSEIEIENLIKDVIRVKQNTYNYRSEDALILNYSLMFLYDAYEYGTEITKKYGSSIYKSIGRLFNKDLYIKFFNLNVKTYSYNDFLNTLHTWEGIIENDRTLFESGWREYKNAYLENLDALEEAFGESYVNGLYFEKSTVTIDIQDVKGSYPLTACQNTPNNIPLPLIYTSSNPSIVSIPNKNIYSIDVHKTGTVTIQAKTENGLYKATQQIIVVDSSIQSNLELDANKDYSNYYEFNHDGITLKKVIPEYRVCDWDSSDEGNCVFTVPSTVDGYPVTELDFSELSIKSKRYNDNYFNKIIFPNTLKRLSENCFFRRMDYVECEIIMNEGLEIIGPGAFGAIDFVNRDLVLPSTVKEIGIGAFRRTKFRTMYINCPELTEIPKRCFGDFEKIIFSNEMKKLKTIGRAAFFNGGFVSLPDCVEVLGELALVGCQLDFFPASLIEIGKSCFHHKDIPSNVLPSSVKIIHDDAFQLRKAGSLYLPNSIEYIGKNIINHKVEMLFTYGEETSSGCEILEDSVNASYFEIPYSVTKIGKGFSSKTTVWTNGIDEIDIEPKRKNVDYQREHINLYLKEIDRNGTYGLKNHIFENGSYFDFIEIPVNYLNNTKTTLSGDWIKECVIVGDASEEDLLRYIEILKDAIDIGGTITYRDLLGNLNLLYQNLPLSYTKESKSVYENHEDYIVSPMQLFENQIKDEVGKIQVTVSSNLELSQLDLQYWEENNETRSERHQALGDFVLFEDIYLKQPFYHYFTIDSDASGPYVLSIELDEYQTAENNAALYHINDLGKITRVPISYEEIGTKCKITFETNELGKFAFVRLSISEQIIPYSYRNEFDFSDEETVIDKNTSADYETNESNQIFIGNDEESSIIIQKPTIETNSEDSSESSSTKPNNDSINTNKIIDQIIDEFEFDDSLIHRKDESIEVNDKAVKDFNKYEEIMDHAIILETNKKEEIHIALDQFKDKSYDFYVYQIDEDESLNQVGNIVKPIKQNKVNPIIHDNNHEYYELKLDKGKFFFTYTLKEKEEIDSFLKITGWTVGIGMVVVLLIIINKKKEKK